jgi:hypothetical protein
VRAQVAHPYPFLPAPPPGGAPPNPPPPPNPPRPQGDLTWASQRTGHPAADWRLLQRVSCANPEAFWPALLRELGVKFAAPPARMLQEGASGDPDRCGRTAGPQASCARCERWHLHGQAEGLRPAVSGPGQGLVVLPAAAVSSLARGIR